jgi:hypothetical protein
MPSSDLSQRFTQKWWPLVLFLVIATVFIFRSRHFYWQYLLVFIPALALSLFCLSLAIVEASDETIRYRRFSVWKELRFDEITGCGLSKLRIEVGYVSLKRFVWPWGRLYFLLDEPTPKGTDLVTFIQQRMGR